MSRVPTALLVIAIIAFNIYRLKQEQAHRPPMVSPDVAQLASEAMTHLAQPRLPSLTIHESALALLAADVQLDPSPADPLPGRYADGNFIAQFARTGDGYNGVIGTSDNPLPATAALKGDRWEGSYLVGQQTFFFTAKFDGAALEITSGNTVHRLERVASSTTRASS